MSLLTFANRLPGFRRLWEHFPYGSIETRVQFGIWPRPNYAFGVYQAADLARRLKLNQVSVIEFGVAGGSGLIELERLAEAIGPRLGVNISVFGFDSGEGLPQPEDYRDLPYCWGGGWFKMDIQKLKARLKSARLVLGDVSETVPELRCPPIGFIAFDLDYYSSTKRAFKVFALPDDCRLPRVTCYFDDITSRLCCHNDYIGELCAIREFNSENRDQKICPLHGLEWMLQYRSAWQERIYVQHDFKHPLYSKRIIEPGESATLSLSN